eukprot:2741906-Rhodomonas_salina.1
MDGREGVRKQGDGHGGRGRDGDSQDEPDLHAKLVGGALCGVHDSRANLDNHAVEVRAAHNASPAVGYDGAVFSSLANAPNVAGPL